MNEISLADIKMWIGELLLENKMLQKEIARLRTELEELIGTEKEPVKSSQDNLSDKS